MTRAARAEPPLRFRDLGPLEVERAGAAVPVGGGLLESALALLLIHADRPVGIDALCEAVWGEQGVARSVSTLDSHVFRLRRLLEPDRASGAPATVLLREPGGYRLAVGADQADSTRFVHLAGAAADLLANGDPHGALRHVEEAAGLWRGRPYGAATDRPWAQAAVARLDEIRGQLRETSVGALLAVEAVDRALAELVTAIAEQPLNERLWFYRVRAYRNSGRRAEALQASTAFRTLLVDELGVEPGTELQALHAELVEAPTPADPPSRTLPTVRSRLIGREPEVADVLGKLNPGRLVTLVGTAGCGKTRLAIDVAQRAARRFPDGAWFVDLTAATPERVFETVSSTLELPVGGPADPLEALLRFTASRRMLVVLDNCEHVLDAAAKLVDGLLNGGSDLAVLATSREPLDVHGEEISALDPLRNPAAVELFLDRLDALTPDGERDDEALATVREIATAVEGVPLALELAAARARAYTLTEIASQVRADASALSRVGRGRRSNAPRTVRDAIDTSYRDLPPPLAALHRAAGAVPGPFTAALAAGLVDDTADEVTNAVAGLVHRSLLNPLGPARPGGASRFAQFATIRGHASHLAAQAGEDFAARRDAWVERMVRRRPPLGSPGQNAWYRSLDDDLAGLRATLQHTLTDAPSDIGVAVAGRLGVYWGFRGMGVEGARWLHTAVQAVDADPGLAGPVDRAMVHVVLGSSRTVQGRPDEGRSQVRAGIAAAAGITGDEAVPVCEELTVAAGALARVGDLEALAELAAAVRRMAAGVPALEVIVRHVELIHATVADPRPDLVPRYAALHGDAREADNLFTAWLTAANAGRLLLAGGRAHDAVTWARSAVQASVDAGLRANAYVLEVYGAALGMAGEDAAALRVFGAVEAQHRGAGVPWPRDESVAALVAAMTTRLGQAVAEHARAEGARATLAELARA
jgi:DNA-binding SARP family transcriptional activator